MPRARDLGIEIGLLPTGPTNSALDVTGVGLGHATVSPRRAPTARGPGRRTHGGHDAAWSPRTPTSGPLPAGGAVLNGAGECTGFLSVRVGGAGDADLPHLDDAARPGLRRCLRDRPGASTRRSPTTW